MSESKICDICGKPFTPKMRHPHQRNCVSPECQRERRRRYLARYGRVWRKQHKNYWREYREKSTK